MIRCGQHLNISRGASPDLKLEPHLSFHTDSDCMISQCDLLGLNAFVVVQSKVLRC